MRSGIFPMVSLIIIALERERIGTRGYLVKGRGNLLEVFHAVIIRKPK